MIRTSRPLQGLFTSCVVAWIALLPACSAEPKAQEPSTPKTYSFWPPFPEEPRIQFLASYSSSEDIAPTKSSKLEEIVFGKDANRAELINKPYGVAIRKGRIYVADMRGSAIVVLDLVKKQTRLVGVTGVNRIEHPVAIAVADDGTIYAADNTRGAVFVYDAKEHYSRTFGFPKFKPVGLAVHGDRLYVADLAAQNVVVLNRLTGTRLGTIGEVGDTDGQFRVPVGIATDESGNVYVADVMRCNVQKFDPDGKFLSAMGGQGDFVGAFARPKHIAVDHDGIIYVVDGAFQNVQMFNDQFQMLMHFGAVGEFPGSMNLPAGIAVSDDDLALFKNLLHPGFDPARLVVVTNQFGPTKVLVYALGHRRPDYSAQDMAASAAPVNLGVGTPSAEELKMRNPGGEEPPANPQEAPANPPATPPGAPQ